MNFRSTKSKSYDSGSRGAVLEQTFLEKKLTFKNMNHNRAGNVLVGDNMLIDYHHDKSGHNINLYIKYADFDDDGNIIRIIDYRDVYNVIEKMGYREISREDVHPLLQVKLGLDYDVYVHFNKHD